jgi:hypothetical protein
MVAEGMAQVVEYLSSMHEFKTQYCQKLKKKEKEKEKR